MQKNLIPPWKVLFTKWTQPWNLTGNPPQSVLTHLSRKFKKWSDFHETSYTLPMGRGKNIHEIFFVSNVVSETWCMLIWTMPANTGTKLAKIRLKLIHTLREWIWSWSYLPLIHWGTGRYLMNWIQFVHIKMKQIRSLFSPAKAKKLSSFFTSLPPKQMKIWQCETKSQSKGHEVSSQWQLLHLGTSYIYIYTIFKVINKFGKNIYYKCASFVLLLAGDDHVKLSMTL